MESHRSRQIVVALIFLSLLALPALAGVGAGTAARGLFEYTEP